MFKKIIIIASFLILSLSPLVIQAATPDTSDKPVGTGVDQLKENLNTFGGTTGLTNKAGESDLKGTIANIINIVLGFLGIIAVVMILTGGYQWMMAGGNDETIKEAKSRIKNAVIGLAIVFTSYIVANFAIRQISSATGAGSESGGGSGQNTKPAGGG